jgi:hypothetical protein
MDKIIAFILILVNYTYKNCSGNILGGNQYPKLIAVDGDWMLIDS